jgi:two-component system, response regulator, stage 0 sporulation protein F
MPKLLVVEDEKNLRALYQGELTREGYDVVLAPDGQEALKLLDIEKPDLVVLDIRMPGIDGLETMARLLSRENTLPVILNTAYSAYRDSFLSWSADAYVIKSSDLTELKTKIREVLATRASEKGVTPA